ncbi:MAG: VanZ family protein [Clostridium sp.]|nr:VanZ family protein [Clostridium sp.]
MVNKKKYILRWTMLVLWMCFIFYMSSRSGSESQEQSDLVLSILNFLGLQLNESIKNIASFIVRKTAHVTEYMILYILIFRVVTLYSNTKKSKLIALFCMVLYASTDEIHQLFVSGRSGMVRDVFIDSIGGIIGVGITFVYENIKKKKSLKH